MAKVTYGKILISLSHTLIVQKLDVTSSATNGTIYHFNETRTTANGIEVSR